MEQTKGNKQGRKSGFTTPLKMVWRFFSSIRLALVLILLISALSLFGTFVPGANMFHSWWFLSAGAMLMINIIICSLNRWGNIRLSLHGGLITQEESFYSSGPNHKEIELAYPTDSKYAEIPVEVLKKHGYRVRTETNGGCTYFAADKNRYFRLGTYASHLSLVLFVLAYLLGSYFGFRDTNFTVAVDNTRAVGHNTNLSVQLVSFVDEYYPDNTPKDYRSQVIIFENRQEVKQALVRVNQPLSYKGISIHQMFFGPAVQMQITQNGQILYQGNVALDTLGNNQGLQRHVGSLDLPGGFNIQFISSAINVPDPIIPQGELAVYITQNGAQTGTDTVQKGLTRDINGLEFLYQADSKFSGFQISRDPGGSLIWIASVLFILGITLVLYFPYRQVWILYQSQTSGARRISIRLAASKAYNSSSELKTISDEMADKFNRNNKETGG